MAMGRGKTAEEELEAKPGACAGVQSPSFFRKPTAFCRAVGLHVRGVL